MNGSIVKSCFDKILEQSEINFDSIVKNYYGMDKMRKDGASFRMECPECGSKKSLVYTPAKAIIKCFKCSKDGESSKGPYSWCTKILKMSGKDAIVFLAEKNNIFIEYVGAELTRTKKKTANVIPSPVSEFKTFRDIMLEQSGLTLEDVTGPVKLNDNTLTNMVRYTSGSKNGDQTVKGDDVQIHYKTLYGTEEMYYKRRANGEVYGKPIPFTRTRNQRPEDHLDKNGKPKKYESPFNSGLHIWHPEPLIRKFQAKSPIPILNLQEGEKKADKCTKHAVISCGIMGINNLIDANGLHPDFGLIITQCKTHSVVFTVDSDWQNKLPTGISENIDSRARSFLTAVRKFQQYFYGFTNQGIHLKIYFSFVKPNDNKDKGTDDLLTNTLKGKEEELAKDYEFAMAQGDGQGKYIVCIDITGHSEHKLKELFHLQSKESFIELHKDALKERGEFIFSGTKWKFGDDGTVELAQPLSPDHIFWKKKAGKIPGDERYEFKPDKWVNVSHDRWYIGRYNTNKDSSAYKLILASPVTKTIKIIECFEVIDFILNFLYSINEIDVYNWLFNSDKYLNEKKIQKLWHLNDIIHLLKNEKNTGYMFFKNGFWKITNTEIKHYDINDAPGYIWDEKIKDARPKLDEVPLLKIVKSPDKGYSVDFRQDWEQCHFLKFLFNTSLFSGHWKTPTDLELEEAYKNLITKLTAFGYLMHHFFDPSNTKMVLALDGKERQIGEASGRSGKSQYFSALEKLMTVVVIDGRKPNLLDDKYMFARVTEQTGLIYFDDLDQHVEPGFLYGQISSGKVESRGMHKESKVIPQEYTPKFAASTNYGLKGVLQNDSSLDRLLFIVFSGYYNKDHKPVDDFNGIRFFDDWEYDQWTSFYNLAACCYQSFLEFGIMDFEDKRQKKVFLAAEIGPTFMDWADSYIKDKEYFETWLERPAMQDDYKITNPKYALRPNQFRLKCIMYANFHDRVLNPDKIPLTSMGNLGLVGGRKTTEGKEYFKFGFALPSINLLKIDNSLEPDERLDSNNLPF
jgi:DNA primase